MTARFLLKHYKLWVLREIVRGHRPRLQQTQIQSESLPFRAGEARPPHAGCTIWKSALEGTYGILSLL